MTWTPSGTTTAFDFQDDYQTTLSSSITASDTVIPLTSLPTVSEGTLVIDAGTSKEEEIYFTSLGTGVVNVPSVALGRGVNGTAQTHDAQATVKMLVSAASLQAIKSGGAMTTGSIVTSKIAANAVTAAKLESDLLAGWTLFAATLTYASATSVTSSVDLSAVLSKGDKIKFTQTTVKYFYVTSVSGTTINVTGGTDYTVANAAITSPYYSKQASPYGHPIWFAYTPTYTALAPMTWTSVSTNVARFMMDGTAVTIEISASGTTGGTASSSVIWTTPVTIATNAQSLGWGGYITTGGTSTSGFALGYSSTQIRAIPYNGGNWSLGASSAVQFVTTCEIV